MDAIAIYFRNASFHQLESIASKHGVPGAESLFLRDYPEWESDAGDQEKQKISKILGGKPSCAVLIESQHGFAARKALLLASDLMSSLPPAILDDDHDGLWSAQDVQQAVSTSEQSTIFSIRGCLG